MPNKVSCNNFTRWIKSYIESSKIYGICRRLMTGSTFFSSSSLFWLLLLLPDNLSSHPILLYFTLLLLLLLLLCMESTGIIVDFITIYKMIQMRYISITLLLLLLFAWLKEENDWALYYHPISWFVENVLNRVGCCWWFFVPTVPTKLV